MRKPSVERCANIIRKHGILYKMEPEKSVGSCKGCVFEKQYCNKELTTICTKEHVIFERLNKTK